jgi:hypothetical protein
MIKKDIIRFNDYIVARVILLLALIYMGILVSSIQSEVFFQGDGGMKFMVIKQINAHQGFKYLDLTHPQWIKEIWNKGFFPMKEPFVYSTPRGYLISFPPAFQIVSAFLYDKLGYRGLYVIPLLSILILWTWVFVLLKKRNISERNMALAIFILTFCSPLTLYGAMYWEHMPTVLLLFAGAVFILNDNGGLIRAALLGFLTGLAIWLRPEALVLDILYAAIVVWIQLKQTQSLSNRIFLVCLFIPVFCFFLFNQIEFNSFFGVHGYQVLNATPLARVIRGLKNLLKLNWLMAKFFPFVLIIISALYMMFKSGLQIDARVKGLLILIPVFCLVCPFILPNYGGGQWGPRYFLPLIPVIVVLIALIFDKQAEFKISDYLRPGSAFFIFFIGYSFYLNSFQGGGHELYWSNYNRIKPTLTYVKSQQDNIIVVNSEHIPMEMGAIFKEKNFMLAETQNSFDSLVTLLRKREGARFIYISEVNISPGLPNLMNGLQKALVKKGNYYLGEYALN